MKVMIKNTLKLVSCLSAVALLFSLGGCGDKPFEWDLPLALSSHKLVIPSDAGATHILVFCTSDWTVGFDREISWGSLDRRTGSGNTDFVFSFSANYGISRKVTVWLTSGSLRDSVVICQEGELSSATVAFDNSSVSVADTASTITVGFSTDLLFAYSDFKAEVTYYDENGNAADPVLLAVRADDEIGDDDDSGEIDDDVVEEDPEIIVTPWISNVVVSSDHVSFDVARNKKDLYRTADLKVYVEDADDKQYSSMLVVTQIPAGMAY